MEQVTVPYYSMNDRLDLFHYPDHALSILQKTRPVIITVHDIAYVRFPWLLNKSRQIYKKYILNVSIKRADVIVADSYCFHFSFSIYDIVQRTLKHDNLQK